MGCQREQRDDAGHDRIPVQDSRQGTDLEVGPEGLEEVAIRSQRHTANHVAEGRTKKYREKRTRNPEDEVKKALPHGILHVGAELDADGSQHQQP